ncbi:MAG: transposase [Verrucomicrobiae bacterium]|nr:transposase [Verrucomicrobiae bacterium]
MVRSRCAPWVFWKDSKAGWFTNFLSAYYRLDGLKHVLCNAHLFRDFIYVHEDHGQPWAADMMALLLEAKSLNSDKDRELSGGRTIGPKTLKRLHERYVEILEAGYAINPEPERDLRRMKVKQKISGCFRNPDHGRAFANLRSIITSAKKQAINVLEILTLTLNDLQKPQQALLDGYIYIQSIGISE